VEYIQVVTAIVYNVIVEIVGFAVAVCKEIGPTIS